MKQRLHSASDTPAMVVHHVREIQLRLLSVAGIAILGMVVGYVFHEQLFAFIKAPLNGPLHYTSPAGSFTFIIKICVVLGVIITLPMAIYNVIMFVRPAFAKQLTKLRVYSTTFMSFLLAVAGAAFAFFVLIPLALRFFYKFQVTGLEAIISADEYLQFVLGVIVTFVIIFQLPLIISLIDHITPLPPKKLLKAEKYVIVGSVLIAVVVPFALDPSIQLLIASPIIVLYNLSIGIVALQHRLQTRHSKKATKATPPSSAPFMPKQAPLEQTPRPAAQPQSAAPVASTQALVKTPALRRPSAGRSLDGTQIRRKRTHPQKPAVQRTSPHVRSQPQKNGQLISDMRRPVQL